MKYSIIIPTFNHLEDCLEPCLESIFKYTDLADVEIIVVANGCTDGTHAYLTLRDFGGLIFIDPIGYTRAINEGARVATGEYLIFLNNDCILLEQEKNTWLKQLTEPFENNDDIAVTGPLTGIALDTVEFVVFFCAMTPRKLFEELGGLDEIFTPGYGEDIDYCARAFKRKLRVTSVPSSEKRDVFYNKTMATGTFPIYHAAEKTMHDETLDWSKIPNGGSWDAVKTRNIEVLKKRYPDKDYTLLIKYDDIQLYTTIVRQNEYRLEEFMVKDKVVVDIGANIGMFTGLALKYKPLKVVSIEPVEDNFNRLLKLYADEPRVAALQLAVTDTSDKLAYFKDASTSAHMVDVPDRYSANTITLTDITDNISENHKDLVLKLDCEGAEHEILLSSPLKTIRRFKYILIEMHEGDYIPPEHTIKSLKAHLEKCGYTLTHEGGYFAWTEYPDGTRSESVDTPMRVCRYERGVESRDVEGAKVAVIMPAFNSEQYIRKSIEGVLSQTYSNLTLFIGNDGSTDSTLDIALEYARKDKRVTVIASEPVYIPDVLVNLSVKSSGSAHTRNLLIEEAKKYADFEYIAYCDSDDIWDSDHLEKAMELLSMSKVGMVYSDCRYVFPNGTPAIPYGFPYFKNFSRKELLMKNFIFISTVVHRLKYFPDGGFDSKCMPKDDWDMWLRVSYSTSVLHNSTVTVTYLEKNSEYYNKDHSILSTYRVKEKHVYRDTYRYSIIIPTYNRCDDLLRPCLQSIIKYTNLKDVEVLIVANGCTDNTANYVTSLGSNFKLLWSDDKLGYTKAVNLGLQAASGDYIILLNNDTVLIEQPLNRWLDLMRRPLENNKGVGMTGPMVFKGVEGESNDFVMFFCCMMSKKILDEIGLLDENFSPGGVEDVDYGLRMSMAGYTMVQVPENIERRDIGNGLTSASFPIYHIGGSTVRKEDDWDKILVRNNEYLKKKFPKVFHGIGWIEQEKDYKVYDCFPFFNEFDMLEMRLEELYDVVDKFIITEGTHTHQGELKPMYLQGNLERFAKYADKMIIHTVKFKIGQHSWERENAQRDAALEILENIAQDQDYIMISDVDEIPRPKCIKAHIEKSTDAIGIFKQERYMYHLNYRNVTTDEPQANSKIVRYRILKNTNLCYLRYCERHKEFPYYHFENGGWHFTFMGGAEQVIQKVKAFAHHEYNTPELTDMDRIATLIDTGKDFYTAETTWETVPVDDSYPETIKANLDKYKDMGWLRE
jgi:beta-1,4-mannosyl-glycoprotein beta-1,4-N-acetylglucosaminyltransferase